MVTDYTGAVAGSYLSLPFGDGFSPSGDDESLNNFALLWHDFASATDHAQFRQYSEAQGRWMTPDPDDGSYDFSNPPSFNRYSYVLNNPLSFVDPQGLFTLPPQDGGGGDCWWCWDWGGLGGTGGPIVPPSGGNGGSGGAPSKYCSASGYSNARNFVAANQAAATQVANSLNTTPGNLLGLSGFESGWGTGPLIRAGTNNYFSLKAGPAFATGATGQFTLGSNTFWTYSSYLGSAQAFANSYFGARVNGITDPVAFAQAMNSGGKFNSEQRSVPYNTTLVNSINVANGVLQCP